jgi:glutathione S-transferase
MNEEEYESLTDSMPLRRQFYRRMNLEGGGFDERDTEDSHQRLRSALEKVDQAVRESNWICGAQFTLADMTLMPTVVRLYDLGMAYLWEDLPGLADW